MINQFFRFIILSQTTFYYIFKVQKYKKTKDVLLQKFPISLNFGFNKFST